MANTIKVGHIYLLQGDTKPKYYCISVNRSKDVATLQNIVSGYIVEAHNIKFEPDGSITWSHSTGGFFAEGSN